MHLPNATKKTLSGLSWLGQDDKDRTLRIQNIAKYFVDNIGTREQIELFETLRMCA